MGISINGPSFNPNTSSSNSSTSSFEKLSSGSRINRAGDDAAGLAISQRLSAQIGGFNAASRNAGNALSSIQVADGALNSLTKNIGRIQELSLQAANGSLNDQDRRALQEEANQLVDESTRILEQTNFNGKALLSSDENSNVQLENAGTEIEVKGKNLAAEFESLGFKDIDISSQTGASSALSVLSNVSEEVNSRASELGAVSNRIESTIDTIATSKINSEEARSRISDADYAKVTTDLAASLIREQAENAVRSQANGQQDFILKLLQP